MDALLYPKGARWLVVFETDLPFLLLAK